MTQPPRRTSQPFAQLAGAQRSFNETVAAMRATPARRGWQADESRSLPAGAALFAYRLVWADHKDAGRAAYQAEIGPGDIILNYHGQWLRVLSRTPIYDQDSPYDALLRVEPA